MKAIHGGKAKNDRFDSRKIAALMRVKLDILPATPSTMTPRPCTACAPCRALDRSSPWSSCTRSATSIGSLGCRILLPMPGWSSAPRNRPASETETVAARSATPYPSWPINSAGRCTTSSNGTRLLTWRSGWRVLCVSTRRDRRDCRVQAFVRHIFQLETSILGAVLAGIELSDQL